MKLKPYLTRWCQVSLILCLTYIFWGFLQVVNVQAATIEEGKALFEQSCASCHSIDGSKTSYGPDLQDVTQRRDRDWLVQWIANPDQVLSSGDKIATELVEKYNGVPMPNMGLQSDQVESIVSYLESIGGNSANPVETNAVNPVETEKPIAETTNTLTGDPLKGQKLFAGMTHFSNGGPACMSCHTVNTVGTLRGGTLGPNLTHVVDRYTLEGLKGVLPSLPYPTMQGIYEGKLLTESEQADLLSFFNQANQSDLGNRGQGIRTSEIKGLFSSVSPTVKFILLGIGGFFLLALIGQLTWRDRLSGVRQRLLQENKS
jgi:putative heme-binding domain-containing protein